MGGSPVKPRSPCGLVRRPLPRPDPVYRLLTRDLPAPPRVTRVGDDDPRADHTTAWLGPHNVISLLRQPQLRRFFIAHGQSQLGTGAGYVALLLFAYQRLHSGWAVALVLLADFLPGILLSAYFGVLADRHSRQRLAIAAELVRGAAFVGLALSTSFSATVGLALLAGVGTALFRPALSAAPISV